MVVPIAPSMMAMRFWSSFWRGWSDRNMCLGASKERASAGTLALRGAGLLLFGDGEDDLKKRLLGFAARGRARGYREPGASQHAAQRARGEAGVPLAVRTGHGALAMLVEREDDEAAAGSQHPGALLERARRPLCVGERVKHDHGIERRWPER